MRHLLQVFKKSARRLVWPYLPAFERLVCDLFPVLPNKIGTDLRHKQNVKCGEMHKAANSVDEPAFHTYRQLCVPCAGYVVSGGVASSIVATSIVATKVLA